MIRPRSTTLDHISVALAGCGKSDPCNGIAGTCVSLTVQSSTVSMVDSLQISATGAVTATQGTSGVRSSLPIHVALKFPASVSGALHLDVNGLLSSMLVGSGSTDITVMPAQHSSATVTLVGTSGAGFDMSESDMAGTNGDMPSSGDMATIPCDPKGVSGPQCVWRWQTPLPQGDDILSVYAFADDDVFALTAANTILHRDANGWSIMPARPTAAVGQFTARNMAGGGTSDLYVVGFSSLGNQPPQVFHSTDKAVTWVQETLPTFSTVVNLYGVATTGTLAILAGDSGHIVSRNSSGTWTDFQTPNPSGFVSAAMTTSVSVAVGGTGIIYSAPTGTNTWTQRTAPTPTFQIIAACTGTTAFTTTRFWAVGYGGGIVSSTDGTTWVNQTSGIGTILYGCAAADANNVWTFGAGGTVIAASNGGLPGAGTWGGETSGVAGTIVLHAGAHSPGTSLVLSGQEGTIIRSINAGMTFTPELMGPHDVWTAITGVAPQTVYAVGQGGAIARTTDGKTWTKLTNTGTTSNLTAVWGTSATNIYAVGDMGTVVHSTDGMTFTKYTGGGIAATSSLTDISGLSASKVVAVGSGGVYQSTDNGTTWLPVTVTGMTTTPLSVFGMGGDLWIGADIGTLTMGQVFHSTNGTTWTAQPIPGPNGAQPTTQIRGRMPGDIFVISSAAGVVSRSANGGMTWTTVAPTNLALSDGARSLAVTPTGNYVYVSTNSGLAVSQDEGANWVRGDTTRISVNQTRGLFAFADNDVYAIESGGSLSSIIHYGN